MKTSKAGINLVKQFEGLRLTAYRCQAGVWTVGWGSTKNVKPGDVITEAEAEQRLKDDITNTESQLLKALNADEVEVSQCQFDALVSFAFNLGVYTLVHGSKNAKVIDISSIWRNLKAGKLQAAGDAFMLYTKAGNKTSEGLVRRRRTERELFLGY